MRTFPLLLGFGALVGAAAAPAPRSDAAAFTTHFTPLVSAMFDRDESIPFPAQTGTERRQRAALNRCFRALLPDSPDLAGDFRLAKRLAGILERGFPGDAEFASLLEALDADLALDATDARDELEVTVALLAEGKFKVKAGARLALADAIWTQAQAEPAPGPRLALRGKSHRQVLKGTKLAAKGQPGGPASPSTMTATVDGSPWEANNDYGTGVTGIVQSAQATGGIRKVIVTGRRILPSTGPPDPPNPPLPGDLTRLQITIQRVSQDLVAGTTYTIGTADGVNCTASWYEEPEGGEVRNAVATSGSVTLQTIDIGFGIATVAGTFDLVLYDGVAAVTFPISTGAFEAVDVPHQLVE